MDEEICIVGLGYVGLPLLTQSISQGLEVKGYDIDSSKISSLKNGESPIDEERLHREVEEYVEPGHVSQEEEVLEGRDYYVITVPTPVEGKEPNYEYVKSASETVSNYLSEGSTVVLESTVAPGTCRKVVRPILEESGYEVGEDIHLAFCPERVDPGNEKWTIRNIPRVLGAYSDRGREKAREFYDNALEADIFEASSLEVAEASKVTENAFRDINIAYANELAKTFDSIGVDAKEVIEAADTKPFGFMAHYPGAGVGGHCIPVDPYFLIKESQDAGHDPQLLSKAREINESMPEYTVQKVMKGLNQDEKPVKNSEIALLGLAYKGGVDDKRRSPALEIKQKLQDLGGDVLVYDPYLPEDSDLESLEEVLDSDCILIATDHQEFLELGGKDLTDVSCVVDGRNMLDEERIQTRYYGIGN
jgi:UDP-N-acetyl-D-glucosamine dehydrogenase